MPSTSLNLNSLKHITVTLSHTLTPHDLFHITSLELTMLYIEAPSRAQCKTQNNEKPTHATTGKFKPETGLGKVQELVTNYTSKMTLLAIQAAFTKIPSLSVLSRSTAHLSGGMLVTVFGSPFVDTGESLRCRWRQVGSDGQVIVPTVEYQTPPKGIIFLSSSAIVCT